MKIHLVNPSDLSFGTGVVAPRWLYVLASATPERFGKPILCDESLQQIDESKIQPGDVVGIGIHTSNALRGYAIGRTARKRGAYVIFGGIHATLYPDEAYQVGGAHSVVTGDGDVIWSQVLADCSNGGPKELYNAGHIEPDQFLPGRWDLMPDDRYMWASVQTTRGCPKHCSFCSVWRTDGQRPRQRNSERVIREVVELRRKGFRFIVLADDNFYPVTLRDIEIADRRENKERRDHLISLREERFELLRWMKRLPDDMVFFTQITMEAAEDPTFLKAMKEAKIRGVLVGIESVTPDGLKSIFKDFNLFGDNLAKHLRTFKEHDIHVLGSFIFGLPTDQPSTFKATADLAEKAELAFAQFVTLSVFPGTVDFQRWEKTLTNKSTVSGFPASRYWLVPRDQRKELNLPHPTMTSNEIREHTQETWDQFYSLKSIYKRSNFLSSIKSRLAFLLISKLYRQMYANTGISTDSARINQSKNWARWIAKPCQKLFKADYMPHLQVPDLTD